MCLNCGVVTKWNASEEAELNENKPGEAPFDIDRRAAYAIAEVGPGRESLATFCGIMSISLPSETKCCKNLRGLVAMITSQECFGLCEEVFTFLKIFFVL